jgi:hypothetical protein
MCLYPGSRLCLVLCSRLSNPTEERIKYLTDPGAGPARLFIPPIYSLANVAMIIGTGLMATGISHSVGMLLMSLRLCQVPFA